MFAIPLRHSYECLLLLEGRYVVAVTEQGGTTSHAAGVARALGKPCVVGCGPGTVSPLIGRRVTVDGNTGIVYDGELPLQIQTETADPYLRQLLEWALERTSIRIELEAPPGVAPLEIAGSKQIGDASELSQSLAELPAGGCVCGTLFSQDDSAVQAAIAAGVTMIVTSPRLPALLVAHRLSPPGASGQNRANTEADHVEAS